MTNVFIAESAWCTITREVSHFANMSFIGKEAIVYPMFGYFRKEDCFKAPWEMLELEDIDCFVVPFAAPPPRELTDHGAFRASLKFKTPQEREKFQQIMGGWSSFLDDKYYPMLRVGNVHSHQFATDKTWPSKGGSQTDYPRILNLWKDLKEEGLNTAPEIIICKSRSKTEKWVACCFALDKDQEIVDLGHAEIVSDYHPLMNNLLTAHYTKTSLGQKWEERQKKILPGIENIKTFNSGWRSFAVNCLFNGYVFIHLPPTFPRCDFVLYQVFYSRIKLWGRIYRWYKKDHTFRFDLDEICSKHIWAEVRI
ncbi:MAG: hypothetical protein Q8R29_02080 [bacterium]|nr:hypothetical protein [bacterium]